MLTKEYGLFSEQFMFCKLGTFRAPKYLTDYQIVMDFQWNQLESLHLINLGFVM